MVWPLRAACVVITVTMMAWTSVDSASTDIATATASLEALESTKASLFAKVSRLETLLAKAQERMKRIQFRDSGDLADRNQLQQQLIDSLTEKVKEAQQALDNAAATGTAAQNLAGATAAEIPDLSAAVNDVNSDKTAMDNGINTLGNSLSAFPVGFQSNLDSQIAAFNATVQSAVVDVDTLRAFLDSQNCEYGTLRAAVESTTSVTFNTDFDETPSVVTSIVGFRAHLVEHYHGSYPHGSHGHSSSSYYATHVDLLGFNVTVTASDQNGFTLDITELNDDVVEPKDVYIRYMACQNLDENVA